MDETPLPLTTTEAAAVLGVSSLTVWRWIKAGKLAAIRYPGGQFRIEVAEIERVRAGESAAS